VFVVTQKIRPGFKGDSTGGSSKAKIKDKEFLGDSKEVGVLGLRTSFIGKDKGLQKAKKDR